MAKYDAQIGDLKTHLASAKHVLIALPQNLSSDKLAAGLSLMLSLKAAGKEVTILSQGEPQVSHTNLYGVGEVKKQLPQNASGDFVITLEGVVQNGLVPALEKLDWYPEGNNLNLVFHTVPGQKFEPYNISHKYQGSTQVNLIFVLGAASLQDLGEIYPMNISQFTGVPIVNIDNNPSNSNFGFINVVDAQVSSLSEIAMQILLTLGTPIDQDIASNVVTGIYDATANLTQNIKPDTFMSLGTAMQYGGKVPGAAPITPQPQPVAQQPVQQVAPQPQPMQQPIPQPQPMIQPLAPQPAIPQMPSFPETSNPGFDLSKVLQIPPMPDQPVTPATPAPPTEQMPSQDERPVGEAAMSTPAEGDTANPAPDWLTPKIYKGGSLG